jgi:hypothetical protein
MYVLTDNQNVKKYPYSIDELRRSHPNVSFPRDMSADVLAEYNVYQVYATNPIFNLDTQVCSENGCVYNSETKRWEVAWLIRDFTQEEIEQRTNDKKNAIRLDRNTRLMQSDWTQVKDIPDSISTPWAIYREALRNVPQQEGFPWDIQWPVAPA